jgi:hypothetical protein
MLEQLCAAQDKIKETRRAYAAGTATYDDMKTAAVALLELRQQAEIKRFGKAKTRITSVAIASLLR